MKKRKKIIIVLPLTLDSLPSTKAYTRSVLVEIIFFVRNTKIVGVPPVPLSVSLRFTKTHFTPPPNLLNKYSLNSLSKIIL